MHVEFYNIQGNLLFTANGGDERKSSEIHFK